MSTFNRIAIIGNGGGGKTTLARALAIQYSFPLTHVDSIQFLVGMKVRDANETSGILNHLANEERWLIDGFGSFDVMKHRFHRADRIIFVDFPIWRHYFWCAKRQVRSLWSPRSELPTGCDEATFAYTIKLFRTLWRVHKQIRPKLIDLFQSDDLKNKVVRIETFAEWNRTFSEGLAMPNNL